MLDQRVVASPVPAPVAGRELVAGGRPGDVALIDGRPGHRREITFAEMDTLLDERADQLGLTRRSLVVLAASNTTEFALTYLALLRDRHVPLLAGRHVAQLADTWNADAVVGTNDSGTQVEIRRDGGRAHDLHPDLALLMSTSGSTGAAKLVRLSHRNVLSNAAAIGTFLGLSPADRGITSLPLHYCYGLSVLHSHLLAGAAVVFTTASVIDPCFTYALQTHGVTNVAGVPHSFELLERAGPDAIAVPSLRFVTQAGGRLAPAKVRRWVERTESWDADFYVMYGQTEATARMAYLPPALARRRPEAVGVAIPGGELVLRPIDGFPPEVGELVYRGPNVMMGYATRVEELAEGSQLDELPTGDLGRYHADDGVFEIVGRASRFVKPLGVRVDLQQVEAVLSARGAEPAPELAVGGDDERLVLVAPGGDAARIVDAVGELTGLPRSLVTVEVDRQIPRTSAGKVDYAAVASLGTPAGLLTEGGAPDGAPATGERSVVAVLRAVLGRNHVAPTDTFVSLGADSLNYVECSLRLERVLGRLPADWHVMTVAELEATSPRRPRSTLDTTVVLRALGICAIVSTHMKLLYYPGGAHLMLAVVGYNFSRFQLPIAGATERLRAGARSVARAAVPTMIWVAAGMVLVGGYSGATLALLNNYLGPPTHQNGRWHYWFIEAFVQLTIAATVLVAIPVVRRLERRAPFPFALGVLGALLTWRFHVLEIEGIVNFRFRTHGVAWFFALGWLVHQSRQRWQQVVTTVLCLLTIPGSFGRPEREWFIAVGLLVLLWCKDLPVPRALRLPISTIAAASIWIFISHFRVFPPLARTLPIGVAYALTLAAGVAIAGLVALAGRRARALVSLARLSRSRSRSEHHGLAAVDEDAVFEVGAHRPREHGRLEIATGPG